MAGTSGGEVNRGIRSWPEKTEIKVGITTDPASPNPTESSSYPGITVDSAGRRRQKTPSKVRLAVISIPEIGYGKSSVVWQSAASQLIYHVMEMFPDGGPVDKEISIGCWPSLTGVYMARKKLLPEWGYGFTHRGVSLHVGKSSDGHELIVRYRPWEVAPGEFERWVEAGYPKTLGRPKMTESVAVGGPAKEIVKVRANDSVGLKIRDDKDRLINRFPTP